MRLGDLPKHPHFPKLVTEIETVLDNNREKLIAKAGVADEYILRVAAGKCQAIGEILTELKEAERKAKED